MDPGGKVDQAVKSAYVSTGHLPPPEQVRALVDEAYETLQVRRRGQELRGLPGAGPGAERPVRHLRGRDQRQRLRGRGRRPRVHDHERLQAVRVRPGLSGAGRARRSASKLGVNATGLAFNSLAAIERSADGRTNPMVNSGAIATTSLVPGATLEAKWQFIHDGLSRFAGRTLPLNEEVYASASETNFRNQSIARLLQSYEPDLHGPGRGDRPVHQAVLAERQRQGSGGDGRDPGRRRGEPAHQGARGRRRSSATTRWR